MSKNASLHTAICQLNSEALSLFLMDYHSSDTENSVLAEGICGQSFPTHLHELVAGICLRNPFWNDYRLLSFFAKRNIELTIEKLQQLKSECGVASKAAVCRTLMAIYFDNKESLSPQQIGFVERINPLFRDREITSSAPGEILLYECIFIRRLSRKVKGMLYLHIFIDTFNGYVFGQFSQERAISLGFALLQKTIIPFYNKQNYEITGILSSIKGIQDNQAFAKNKKMLPPTCKWKETPNLLGTMQGFCKFVLSDFFDGLRLHNTSYIDLDTPFARWLKNQNSSHPFEKRFSILDYKDFLNCTRLSLE